MAVLSSHKGFMKRLPPPPAPLEEPARGGASSSHSHEPELKGSFSSHAIKEAIWNLSIENRRRADKYGIDLRGLERWSHIQRTRDTFASARLGIDLTSDENLDRANNIDALNSTDRHEELDQNELQHLAIREKGEIEEINKRRGIINAECLENWRMVEGISTQLQKIKQQKLDASDSNTEPAFAKSIIDLNNKLTELAKNLVEAKSNRADLMKAWNIEHKQLDAKEKKIKQLYETLKEQYLFDAGIRKLNLRFLRALMTGRA